MPRRNNNAGQPQAHVSGVVYGQSRGLLKQLIRRLDHAHCALAITTAAASVTPRPCRACADCVRLAMSIIEREAAQ